MDPNLLIPLVAFVAFVTLALTRRQAPKPQPTKAAAAPAPARSPVERKASGEPTAPAPRPVPRLHEDEEDLDITVIKAVVIGDLLAEQSTKDGASELDAGDESSGRQKLPTVALSYEDEADAEEVTAPVARILISAAGDSDRGQRRPRNEDCLLVLPERSLFAVADGMGGYRGGEIASTLAIDTIRHAFETENFEGKVECKVPIPRRGRELACAMQMANQAIRAMAEVDPELAQMGTTLVAARFSPNKQRVYIGHVGDSRCYRLRGEVLRQLTTDHTLSSLGVKGAHAHELYQAMGIKPNITIDLIVDKPAEEDIYLLCSDGLSKMVTDDQIRDVLLSEPDLEAAVYGLIEMANDRGGKDNITLILVKVLARLPRDVTRVS